MLVHPTTTSTTVETATYKDGAETETEEGVVDRMIRPRIEERVRWLFPRIETSPLSVVV